MGQRDRLSDKDVQKLNSMYQCKTTGSSTSTPTTIGNRPIRPSGATNVPNRPVLNFLGNLVSGFFQEENNATLANTTELITNSVTE